MKSDIFKPWVSIWITFPTFIKSISYLSAWLLSTIISQSIPGTFIPLSIFLVQDCFSKNFIIFLPSSSNFLLDWLETSISMSLSFGGPSFFSIISITTPGIVSNLLSRFFKISLALGLFFQSINSNFILPIISSDPSLLSPFTFPIFEYIFEILSFSNTNLSTFLIILSLSSKDKFPRAWTTTSA